MKLESVDIRKLKPAKYNPRVNLQPGDPEFEKIRRSIKHFGYVDPIIVNEDGTVIGGHQRLKVLEDLGYTQIDVIRVRISKRDEKALNIALNKIDGSWDMPMLADLMQDLNAEEYDLSLTGFDAEAIDELLGVKDDDDGPGSKERGNARENTYRQYNMHLLDDDYDGFYEMPLIHAEQHIPDKLIGFNYAKSSDDTGAGIHCFVDDYQFERLWNSPEQYTEMLSKYDCVLSPDFSLYMDMPMAMKIWNIFRSRTIGHYWQQEGLRVIPTISWAEPATFAFCFDGIERGGTVAVSTIGVKREDDAFQIWKAGMDEMIKVIQPSAILVYGGVLEYSYSKGIQIKNYSNAVTDRMAASARKEK